MDHLTSRNGQGRSPNTSPGTEETSTETRLSPVRSLGREFSLQPSTLRDALAIPEHANDLARVKVFLKDYSKKITAAIADGQLDSGEATQFVAIYREFAGRIDDHSARKAPQIRRMILSLASSIESLANEPQREPGILTAAWQQTLNDAFENENFDLIKVLQRVLPDTGPDSHIVRARLNELFQHRPTCWCKDLNSISEVSSVSPDSDIVITELQTLLNKFGEIGITEKETEDLRSILVRRGNIEVTELVHAKYGALACDSWRALREISDIAPPPRLVDHVIATGNLATVIEIATLCNVVPPPTLVDRAIATDNLATVMKIATLCNVDPPTLVDHVVAAGDLATVIEIATLCNVVPPPTLVDHVVAAGDLARVREIATLCNVELSDEQIQECQRVYSDSVQRQYEQILLRHRRRTYTYIDSIKQLQNESGITPQFTQGQVEPLLQEYLVSGDWECMQGVIEVTGLRPPKAIVTSKALQEVDSGNWRASAHSPTERIQTLKKCLGEDIVIPEDDMQARFAKAISEDRPVAVYNLHVAFGFTPSVSADEARSFMLRHVLSEFPSVSDLERVFDLQLNITPTEVAALYDNAFTNSAYDRISRIMDVTGTPPDATRLRAAIEKLAQTEIAQEERITWPRETKIILERFGLSLSNTFVRNLYEGCVTDNTIAIHAIKGINELSNGMLPQDLARKAFKVLATAEKVETGLFPHSATYVKERPRTSIFESIFELSGRVSPRLDPSVVQDYYRVCMQDYYREYMTVESTPYLAIVHGENLQALFDSIKKVRSLTGIAPNFDPQQIQALYRECLLRKDLEIFAIIVKETNVEFSVDQANLSDIYSRTLQLEEDWAETLKSIAKETGVQPSFSEGELTDKATALAKAGKVFAWRDLRDYGYNPDVAHIQSAFQYWVDWEFSGRVTWQNEIYWTKTDFCIAVAKLLYEETGVRPSDKQLADLYISEFSKENQRGSYGVRYVKALTEALSVEPTQSFIDSLSSYLLDRGFSQGIPDLVTATGLTPGVDSEKVTRAADPLVESGSTEEMIALSKALGLKYCPVTPDTVQQKYRNIITDDSSWNDKLPQLVKLLDATGVKPDLEQAEIDLAYRKLENRWHPQWERFRDFSGQAPSSEVVQGRYVEHFSDRYLYLDWIARIRDFTGVAPSQATVDKVGNAYARNANLHRIEELANITQIQPNVSIEAALAGYESAVVELEVANFTTIYGVAQEFLKTTNYFENICRVPPSQEVVARAFRATLGQSVLARPWEDEILNEKFDIPDPTMTQSIYADLLIYPGLFDRDDLKPSRIVGKLYEVYERTGVKPNIPQMVKAPALRNGAPTESAIRTRLQAIYQELALGGDIGSVRSLVELTLEPEPNQLQVLYSLVIMSESGNSGELVHLLVSSTGTPPDNQIVAARYQELYKDLIRSPEKIVAFCTGVGIAPSEELLQECYQRLFQLYIENYAQDSSRFLRLLQELKNATRVTPVFDREFALSCYKYCVTRGDSFWYGKLETVNEYHNLSGDDKRKAVTTGIVELLERKGAEEEEEEEVAYARYFTPEHGFSGQLNPEDFPPCLRSVLVNFELTTPTAFCTFLTEEPEYSAFISSADFPAKVTLEERTAAKQLHISLTNAEILCQANVDVQQLAREKNFEELLNGLNTYCAEWQDYQNIYTPFQHGAEIFGYKQMFRYVEGEDLHQALHAFDRIVELHRTSGLTAQQFYTQILQQVHRDGARYDEGSACDHLNMIAQTLDLNIEDTLGGASRHGVEQWNRLVESFDSSSAVFSSWGNLKRYHQLTQLDERSELLFKLEKLRETGNEKLYHWIETLAFHQESNVSIQDIMSFWFNPASFLNAGDHHTPMEVHNRKKPINYVDIPNLDLTAEELRDALVEGVLDRIQAFPPMEIVYQIPKISVREALRQALGSREGNIPPKARRGGKLFQLASNILKSDRVGLKAFLDGQSVLPETEEKLLKAITDNRWGMEVDTVAIRAKVNLKSDPDGILAGNDTACCMPFGSGKNNVYTFNPITALFTVQLEMRDGTFRTIAQSVLTEDQDIKTSVAEVIGELERTDVHLTDILPEEVLKEAPSYLACDNVELAPNYRQSRYAELIGTVYGDFFREYLNRFGERKNLSREFIPVGQQYSRALSHLPEEPNTFAPRAPLSYSDKLGEKVYRLDIPEARTSWLREILTPEVEDRRSSAAISVRGVEPLTYRDTIPISYLEGKAYRDNEALIVGLHNIENALIASGINNELKGRPNLSVKYIQKGRVMGYVVAYEGRLNQQDYDEQEDGKDKPVVYVADMAAEERSTLTGGKLVQAFLALYVENYIEKGNLVPIYAQLREQTSYRLLQRKLARLAKQAGVEMDVQELESYQKDGDTMHVVLITPRSSAKQ